MKDKQTEKYKPFKDRKYLNKKNSRVKKKITRQKLSGKSMRCCDR